LVHRFVLPPVGDVQLDLIPGTGLGTLRHGQADPGPPLVTV
jgi:hypothetical protein